MITVDRKLLADLRCSFLAHVDLNTCYPHERKIIADVDAALSEPQGETPETDALLNPLTGIEPTIYVVFEHARSLDVMDMIAALEQRLKEKNT